MTDIEKITAAAERAADAIAKEPMTLPERLRAILSEVSTIVPWRKTIGEAATRIQTLEAEVCRRLRTPSEGLAAKLSAIARVLRTKGTQEFTATEAEWIERAATRIQTLEAALRECDRKAAERCELIALRERDNWMIYESIQYRTCDNIAKAIRATIPQKGTPDE